MHKVYRVVLYNTVPKERGEGEREREGERGRGRGRGRESLIIDFLLPSINMQGHK